MGILKLISKQEDAILTCPKCGASVEECDFIQKSSGIVLAFTCPKCKARSKMDVTVGPMDTFEQTNPEGGEKRIYAKASGVTYENPDGTRRQDILKRVRHGDELQIIDGALNEKPVKLIRHELGVIGILKGEYFSAFRAKYPTEQPKGVVVKITGGTDGKESLGCNLELVPSGKPKARLTERPKIVFTGANSRLFHVDEHCSGLSDAEPVDISVSMQKINGLHPCKRCAAKFFPNFP